MPRNKANAEETYKAADLPEHLRSSLIGEAVAAALDRIAHDVLHPEVEGQGNPDASTRAVAAIYQAVAAEIRDWHTPKPSPDDMNGGHLPARIGGA